MKNMTEQKPLKNINFRLRLMVTEQRKEILYLKQQLEMERYISKEFKRQITDAKKILTGLLPSSQEVNQKEKVET
jgi:hypothetical protein